MRLIVSICLALWSGIGVMPRADARSHAPASIETCRDAGHALPTAAIARPVRSRARLVLSPILPCASADIAGPSGQRVALRAAPIARVPTARLTAARSRAPPIAG